MELRDLTPLVLPLAIFLRDASTPSMLITSSPTPPAVTAPAEEDDATSSRRHKITCNVTAIEDVKVAEKDSVQAGQTLCDRTEARAALEAKKQQLELALTQQPIAIAPSMALQLPAADFSVEEMGVKAAEAELARAESLPEVQFVSTDIDNNWFRQTTEPERWREHLQRQEQIAQARYRLGEAIGALNQAKIKRQNDEFLFLQQQQQQSQQLLLEQQRSQQQSSYQRAMLLNDLQEIEEKMEAITSIKSPYAGRIRRVKILGQSDRTIQVEISLIADSPQNSTDELE
jgi:biotin carboxyl carrier protein